MRLPRVNWTTGALYLSALLGVWKAFEDAPDREELVLSFLERLGRHVEEKGFRARDMNELYHYFSDALYSWDPFPRFFGEAKRSLWETAVYMGDLYVRLQSGLPWAQALVEEGARPGPEVYEVGRAVEVARWGYDPFWQARPKPRVPSYEEFLALWPKEAPGEEGGQAEEAPGAPAAQGAAPQPAPAPEPAPPPPGEGARPGLRVQVAERVEPEGGMTLEIAVEGRPSYPSRRWEVGQIYFQYYRWRGDQLYHGLLGHWARVATRIELFPRYGGRIGKREEDLASEVQELWWRNLLVLVMERKGLPSEWAAYNFLQEEGLTEADFRANYLPALLVAARARLEGRR